MIETVRNKEGLYSDQMVPFQNYIIHRYSAATETIQYIVYEKSAMIGRHSRITHVKEYGWLGDITTRLLPEDIATLTPYSQQRSKMVREYFTTLQTYAKLVVQTAFPEDFS